MRISILLSMMIFLGACSSPSPVPSRGISSSLVSVKSIFEKKRPQIKFNTSTAVDTLAVDRAKLTVDTMLEKRQDIKEKMAEKGFVVEIMGRDQKLTDLARYSSIKNTQTFDGRNWNETRGVGDISACSVGEENLMCDTVQPYTSEDILVHEFAHSIHFNLDDQTKKEILDAYEKAKKEEIYPLNQYVMATDFEYFAEGAQSWYGVNNRTDVNGGINTRALLREKDPRLASILQKVFGVNELPKRENCQY